MLRHFKMQVHESFRSENILFFASRKNDTNAGTENDVSGNVNLTQPWVFGFEFSRPNSFFSAGFIDSCPDRDVYRHPERQGQPLTTFKKMHDIYALGIVLLEIGKSSHLYPRTKRFHAKGVCVETHVVQGSGALRLRWKGISLPTLGIRKGVLTESRHIWRSMLESIWRIQWGQNIAT